VLHAVSCFLGYLPELSNDHNQPNIPSYVIIVLRHWRQLTLLHSFRHEGMLVFRNLLG